MIENIILKFLILHNFLDFGSIFPDFWQVKWAEVFIESIILKILHLPHNYIIDIEIESFWNIFGRLIANHKV